MMTQTKVIHCNECKCFSWKPVIAGAFIAIGLTFLLNLFGVAIGLTAFGTNDQGTETLAFGGLFATALGVIVSMFATGWLTGYLGRNYCTERHLGAIYGFLAWCLALIITVFLAARVQEYINFYGHFISGTASSFQASNQVATVSTTVSPKGLIISTYIIFVLFFLSAFACSLGGHCGMRHKLKETNNIPDQHGC